MTFARLGCLAILMTLAACSEAKPDGESGAGGSGGAGAAASEGGGVSEGGQPPSGGGDEGGSAAVGALVINEISATADWIELTNTGATAFDLGGLALADAAEPGVPKTDSGIVFPEGTTIAPGAYLFILAKQDGVDPGEQEPQTACDPGPSPCFYAPFGLSDADGDELFVLDGDKVIASAEYPGGAAPDPQSYCRSPDGTGDFEACDATPGAPNP